MQKHETAASFYAFVTTLFSAVNDIQDKPMQTAFTAADLADLAKSWCKETSEKAARATDAAMFTKESPDRTQEENRVAYECRSTTADNMRELHAAMLRLTNALETIASNNRRFALISEDARVAAQVAKENAK